MTPANLLFTIVGVVATLVGLAMLAFAIAKRKSDEKKSSAMLIAGMMLTAFGLVLAGFAIGYATTKPLDLGQGVHG